MIDMSGNLSFGEHMTLKASNTAHLIYHAQYNKTDEERATSETFDIKLVAMLKLAYLIGVQDACRHIPDFLSMEEAINEHLKSSPLT